jgi:hypothetical protein
MKKKKTGLKIEINISNKAVYTLIVIGILIAIGISVYAYGTSDPSTFGHSLGEIEPCAEGQGLQMSSGVWTCKDNYFGNLKTEIIEIGNWNMDTWDTKYISHGLGSNYNKIRHASVFIEDDSQNIVAPLDRVDGNGLASGAINSISSTEIILYRPEIGIFNTPNFDVIPGNNRGWIYITYEE